MTKQEYIQKWNALATSSAPLETRQKAIKELEAKYNKDSVRTAQQQFLESKADSIKEID